MATTFESSTDCWWSNEVFMPGHSKEQEQQQQQQPPFKDFVLISEFSELEGPLPLALVVDETYIDLKPYTDKSSQNTQGQFQKDLKRLGLESFDFNAFVLRAVSVDRSTEYEQIDQDLLTLSSTTPSPLFDVNEPPPCAFSIPDDTQVYFTDSDLNFFAFTHHLTLFDINARGYVHPVALSYITRDRDKVVIRFEELMDRFNEVSREMKKGNYSNFLLDLKYRLLDLEHTESILRNATANTNTTTATSSLAKIADSAKTISDTNNHNNINNNKNIDTTKNNNSNNNNNNNNNSNSNNNTKKVTSSSSSSSPLSSSLSSSPLSSSSSNPQQSQQQKPTLSIQALKQAITATRLMIDTLELNTGHTEERNKESKDSASDDNEHPYIIMKPPKDYKPKYVDTLYPVAHFERKLRSLEQLCLKPEEEEQEEDNKNTKKEEEIEEEAKRRHSMTTITQTVIPLVSIIEPQPANASTQTVSFVNAIAHDMYSEAIKLLKEMTRYLGKSSVELDVDEEELAFIEPLSSAVTIGRTFVLNMDNPKPRKKEQDKQSKEHLKQQQQQQLAEKKEKGSCGLGETNNSNMNMEDSTDDEERKEKDKEIEKKKYFPTNLITSQLWKIKSGDTPSILKTLRRYQSLMVNVIFSLLTGRTVLVKGSLENKKHIQEVVRVLSIFVPGHNQEQHKIIEWFEEKLLTDAEIGSIKLVGLSKEIIDSSIYKLDSSCVFDIDANGHLESSPVYIEGQWINQLLDRIMLFTSDESYLAYLHTVFMTMSLKAFVYHHLYVYDEFKEDRTPHQQNHHHQVTTPSGYLSETSSESSVLNRKWSVRRIMNYLKRIEERENKENGYNELPPSDIMSSTSESYLNDLMITDDDDEEEDDDDSDDDDDDEEDDVVNSSRRSSVRGGRRSEVDDDDDDVDYADENQATVTLQSIKKDNSNKAGALATLFPGLQLHSGKTDNSTQPATTTTTNTTTNITTNATTNNTPTTATTTTTAMSERGGRRGSLSSTTYSRDRIEESDIPGYFDYPPGGDYYFDDGSSDYSSSDEEERASIRSQPREDHVRRVMDEVRPDGMTFVEQRGRQYLQDKLKVYGDDQTIVVYLATSVV